MLSIGQRAGVHAAGRKRDRRTRSRSWGATSRRARSPARVRRATRRRRRSRSRGGVRRGSRTANAWRRHDAHASERSTAAATRLSARPHTPPRKLSAPIDGHRGLEWYDESVGVVDRWVNDRKSASVRAALVEQPSDVLARTRVGDRFSSTSHARTRAAAGRVRVQAASDGLGARAYLIAAGPRFAVIGRCTSRCGSSAACRGCGARRRSGVCDRRSHPGTRPIFVSCTSR
jgi:hypothetical protein